MAALFVFYCCCHSISQVRKLLFFRIARKRLCDNYLQAVKVI
ncbi:MAG: hypothetical protein ACLRZY_15645 [Blautia hansenii]